MNKKQTNKFSFGNKEMEEIHSGIITPKFQSLEFVKDSLRWSGIKKNQLLCFKNKEQKISSKNKNNEGESTNQKQIKIRAKLQQQKTNKLMFFNKFTLSSDKDIQSNSSASIESTKSIQTFRTKTEKEKTTRIKKLASSKKIVKIPQKQFSFSSKVGDYDTSFSFVKQSNSNVQFLKRFKSLDQLLLPFCRKNYFFPSKRIKDTNNDSYISEFLTIKKIDEKSKSIPSFKLSQINVPKKEVFFKSRGKINQRIPLLHSQGRALNNDKIQLISKQNEQLQKMQHF